MVKKTNRVTPVKRFYLRKIMHLFLLIINDEVLNKIYRATFLVSTVTMMIINAGNSTFSKKTMSNDTITVSFDIVFWHKPILILSCHSIIAGLKIARFWVAFLNEYLP